MTPRSIAFHHFGCKVNFAEASSLSRQFRDKGYEIFGFHEKADIYVISTCIVTAVAEKKCRAAIRQAHRLNPGAKIAVIGCFPQLKPEELSKMEGVSLILGHSDKFSLLQAIEGTGSQEIPDLREVTGDGMFIPSFSFGDRTRSFLKIQDGCDYYCAYCTIPLARGHSRSDTIANVIRNVNEVASHGIREVVLSGVNIGDFGRHNGESLLELIRELEKTEDIPRFRLSSIEPDLLKDGIIEHIARSDRFMPHFHIPLQSGSDRVLKAMKRKYNRDLFLSRILKIRSLLPYACIAADVIAGFPGETDEDFAETIEFIESLDISYLHVFTYSRRDNTPAASMAGNVPEKTRKERSDVLHELSGRKKELFYRKNKGRKVHVLFESDSTGGFMHGFSGNYIRVKTPYDPGLVNRIREITLRELDKDLTFLV
jgi:threonylcarbamoyladenosine tRNA methylthiotransferase MtaB